MHKNIPNANKKRHRHTNAFYNSGFTLIELLVAIGIIGILAALAVPQYIQYRSKGFEARARSDLRNMATAQESYFAEYQVYKSCINDTCPAQLPSIIALSPGVTLQITATNTGFIGTSSHSKTDRTCSWNSSQAGSAACS